MRTFLDFNRYMQRLVETTVAHAGPPRILVAVPSVPKGVERIRADVWASVKCGACSQPVTLPAFRGFR